jgi:DNA-directed RNA polymerase subunit RPC12/RpoP
MFEINLACPDCGSYTWIVQESTCICAECGSEYTPEEMEIHFFEIRQ